MALRRPLAHRRLLAFAAGAAAALATWATPLGYALPPSAPLFGRRVALGAAATAPWLIVSPDASRAAYGSNFYNARPEYYEGDMTKKDAGVADSGLGLYPRKVGRKGKYTTDDLLKNCLGKPNNCFSTTGDFIDKKRESVWLIPAWRAPEGTSEDEAWNQLGEVLRFYKPGENGIDYGGFTMVARAQKKRKYFYVQFQSVRGRLDDVEFAVLDASDPNDKRVSICMRSSSRAQINPITLFPEDSRDGGSNAKRLNYIASVMREKGWDAPAITRETHPEYFAANADGFA